MNSGTGTNDGIFRINFDDGTKICFCSPGGEVSGLTYGDRKFNSQGKGKFIVIQHIVGHKHKIISLKLYSIRLKKGFSQ